MIPTVIIEDAATQITRVLCASCEIEIARINREMKMKKPVRAKELLRSHHQTVLDCEIAMRDAK